MRTIEDFTQPPAWGRDAECAQSDPELWFPTNGGSPHRALAICRICPVRLACLEDAMADPLRYGVWGGTTSDERRMARRAARKKGAA